LETRKSIGLASVTIIGQLPPSVRKETINERCFKQKHKLYKSVGRVISAELGIELAKTKKRHVLGRIMQKEIIYTFSANLL